MRSRPSSSAARGATASAHDGGGDDQRQSEDDGADHDIKKRSGLLEDGFLSVWNGYAENDRYNALILREGLEWRDVALLRACGKYLRQSGIAYSSEYMAATLVKHSAIAKLLCDMFHRRFDPQGGQPAQRQKAHDKLDAEISEVLQSVPSLDEDVIVRRFVNLIASINRTELHGE